MIRCDNGSFLIWLDNFIAVLGFNLNLVTPRILLLSRSNPISDWSIFLDRCIHAWTYAASWSLIRCNTQATVMNIVNFRIFCELDVLYALNIFKSHLKWPLHIITRLFLERFSYDLQKWFRWVFFFLISQWIKRSKHGLFFFPPKKTLIWRRHCSIGQSCCNMTSKRCINWFLESFRA